MITGDHALTAAAIASQIGFDGTDSHSSTQVHVVTGTALSLYTDEELADVAGPTAVFARVAPEQKLRLVRALQAFEGAMVLVSHDRSLLRAACDELYLVEGSAVTEYSGDLDDYVRGLQDSAGEAAAAGPPVGRKVQRRQDAQARERLSAVRRPLQARIEALEAEGRL